MGENKKIMREIKFRGLRTDGKGWAYGNLINWHPTLKPRIVWFEQQGETSEELDFEETNYEVIPESVGQFVGLISVDKVDAYCGDIVEYQNTEGEVRKAKLWYDETENCLMVGKISYHKLYNSGFIQPSKLEFVIIGNIHESPELLNN